MRIPRLLLIALVLLTPALAPARAQEMAAQASANPYVQSGIPAEATAENGVMARERAFAAGRRAAWNRLATELGISPPAVSDAQLEAMVTSIVIEQERVSPTRYSGRITVNFNPGRTRGVLGSRAPVAGGGGGGPVEAGAGTMPSAPGPASNWIDAVATYRSMDEWLELQRRLRAHGMVASVQLEAIALDRARLRLGLRAPGPVAAGELAGAGIVMAPGQTAAGTDLWRLGLGTGG
jgi:hypothetical protein